MKCSYRTTFIFLIIYLITTRNRIYASTNRIFYYIVIVLVWCITTYSMLSKYFYMKTLFKLQPSFSYNKRINHSQDTWSPFLQFDTARCLTLRNHKFGFNTICNIINKIVLSMLHVPHCSICITICIWSDLSFILLLLLL